jgi:hypothetical protein
MEAPYRGLNVFTPPFTHLSHHLHARHLAGLFLLISTLQDAAFLLTISWPSAEELAAMKHRGYGT